MTIIANASANAFDVNPFASGQSRTLTRDSDGKSATFYPGDRPGDSVTVVEEGSEYRHGHMQALHAWNYFTSLGYAEATATCDDFAEQDAASVDHLIEFSAPATSAESARIYYGPGEDAFYVNVHPVEVPSEEELERRLANYIATEEAWREEAYGADW